MKKLSLFLVLALAGTTACKKSDDKKAAATETATEAAQGDEAKPAEAAKPTESAPAAPAGAASIKDAADYETKGLEMMDKMVNAFTSAGEDCDKAAENVTQFIAEYGPMFEAIKKFEEGNPDAKTAMDEKMKGKGEEIMGKMMPVVMKCQEHEGLKAAMAKMPQ